jgi:hypothetical protein
MLGACTLIHTLIQVCARALSLSLCLSTMATQGPYSQAQQLREKMVKLNENVHTHMNAVEHNQRLENVPQPSRAQQAYAMVSPRASSGPPAGFQSLPTRNYPVIHAAVQESGVLRTGVAQSVPTKNGTRIGEGQMPSPRSPRLQLGQLSFHGLGGVVCLRAQDVAST